MNSKAHLKKLPNVAPRDSLTSHRSCQGSPAHDPYRLLLHLEYGPSHDSAPQTQLAPDYRLHSDLWSGRCNAWPFLQFLTYQILLPTLRNSHAQSLYFVFANTEYLPWIWHSFLSVKKDTAFVSVSGKRVQVSGTIQALGAEPVLRVKILNTVCVK